MYARVNPSPLGGCSMNSLSKFMNDRRLSFCFRKVLSVLVESLVGRLGGVADAVLRTELLRGTAQADQLTYGSPAHLTIKIFSVDSRLCLAEDDHDALHRHGLLIVLPVACDARVSTSDSPTSIVHTVMAHHGMTRGGTCIYHHAYKHLMHPLRARRALCALRRSRAACLPRVHRAYRIYFSILRRECADSCTISHRFNAWFNANASASYVTSNVPVDIDKSRYAPPLA